MQNVNLRRLPKTRTARVALAGALALTGLVLLASCAQRPPAPEAGVDQIPGYTKLSREFGPLDFTPLQGRRVVLDPGHGGFFRGAIGPGGLTEAEVNLGVALYLRGLLEWAGAEVWLTRTADYDFLSPADSSLSSDLAFRVNFANERQPDVFLSIHHNSTASADPTINETQTYYPLGQEDSCLDLARSIHRHLVVNLEISPARILPGNFHVLRQATVPAVLGEPAMISNPVIEGRLTLAASHELEAKAYFLGLLDYFAGGSPRWSGSAPDTVVIGPELAFEPVRWTFDPGSEAHAPGPDPGTFSLTRNGLPEPYRISPDGFTVIWAPGSTLPSGPTTLELTGRNLAGRSTPARRCVLVTGTGPHLKVQISREHSGNRLPPYDLVRWWFSFGDEPAESKPASLTPGSLDGFALVPRLADPVDRQVEELLRDRLGPAWSSPDCRIEHLAQENRSWHLLSVEGQLPDLVTATPPAGWHDRGLDLGDPPPFSQGSPGLALPAGHRVWVEARGVLPLVDPSPAVADTARTVSGASRFWVADKLVPALYGKVVVLDPQGGGTETDGTGPLGTRGADINLGTAQRARKLLEGAGATVVLTRSDEYAPPAQDKVRLAGQVQADLFLTIGRSQQAATVTVAHHHGSTTGQLWAEAMARCAEQLRPDGGTVATVVAPSYAYLLRHTACPALAVGFPALATLARETQAGTGPWQLAEARAVLLSAAAALGQTGILDRTLDLEVVLSRLPADRALPGVDWAQLDGNFTWLPAPTGAPLVGTRSDSLSCSQRVTLGPGYPDLSSRHTLEIHQGSRWQLWLLDQGDGDPVPRLMLEGP